MLKMAEERYTNNSTEERYDIEGQPLPEALDQDAVNRDAIVSPRRAARRASRAEVIFVIGLSFYAVLAVLAHRYAYFGWDVAVERGIQSIALPGFKTFMISISALGSGWLPWALVV